MSARRNSGGDVSSEKALPGSQHEYGVRDAAFWRGFRLRSGMKVMFALPGGASALRDPVLHRRQLST